MAKKKQRKVWWVLQDSKGNLDDLTGTHELFVYETKKDALATAKIIYADELYDNKHSRINKCTPEMLTPVRIDLSKGLIDGVGR
jgi:hypothetical protein